MRIRLSTFIYLVRLLPYNIKNNDTKFNLKLDVPCKVLFKRMYNDRFKKPYPNELQDYDNRILLNNIDKKILKQWLKI